MAGLLGGGGGNSKSAPALTGLQVQTSAYGRVVTIAFGANRLAPNLVWYGDFRAIPQKQSGGKGGVAGGGKGGSVTTYKYDASVALALCEGPIAGIGQCWLSKTPATLAQTGLTLFTGTYPQTPWGYLTSNHPDEADPYNGIAYLAAGPYALGSSSELPNHNFETFGFGYNQFVTGVPDADPAFISFSLATNVFWGAGFPVQRIGDFYRWTQYAGAAGLWMSPFYADQSSTAERMEELAELSNVEYVWSGGLLNVVPLGDGNLSANGFNYTAPAAPVYEITVDDLVSKGDDQPIRVGRTRPSDQYNNIQFEVQDRTNNYNVSVVEFTGLAEVDVYGKRNPTVKNTNAFCDMNAAKTSVQLFGQRKAQRNEFRFALDPRYCLLDVMDIVSLTYAPLELSQTWVQVTEITERDDGCFDIIAIEYLAGTRTAAQYSFNTGGGYIADYNADPGNVNPPIIFEPPIELLTGSNIEVWAVVSGGTNYGGCEVWASYDDVTYEKVDTIYGGARQGVLSSTFSASANNPETSAALQVDLTMSRGQLLSGTTFDAQNYATLCYVGGELVSYVDATLTAAYKYDLTTIFRDVYNSGNSIHITGTQFGRLDQAVGNVPIEVASIGKTIYLKFRAFNLYQSAIQDLSEVGSYSYNITGSALSSDLPNPMNVTSNFVAGLTELRWDPVVGDLRTPIDYEIRRGVSFANSQVMGRTPNTRFTAFGNGTYWISAHYITPTGENVYSASPPSVVIAGSVLTQNVVATFDESALGFPGTKSDGLAAIFESGEWTLRLGGSGDILGVANILALTDVLFFGGVYSLGTYTPPVPAQRVSLPYVAGCLVAMDWEVVGQSTFDNILSVADILIVNDILGAQFAALVAARPQIRLSQDGTTFGSWQFYAPGQYSFKAIEFQLLVYSTAPEVSTIVSEWTVSIQVPDRFEQFKNQAILAAGSTINFAQAFHVLPGAQVIVLNPSTGDDPPTVTWTTSDITVQCKNGGVGVARNVNITVQGY